MATVAGYKPGVLIDWLGISREQLRYWRRELDPVSTRALFSYQHVLGYAVLKELIANRWINPIHLKRMNLRLFFAWFDAHHTKEELRNTVLMIDKSSAELHFQSSSGYPIAPRALSALVEVVYLAEVEAELLHKVTSLGVSAP